MRRILKEIALAAWLPTTAGTLTFATSWLVWFLTEPGCVPAPDVLCPKLPWGQYITHEVLGDCYIRTFVAISVTGGSDAMLFIRELRNREKDKKIADERLEQEKERLEQEKQQRADDLERADQQRAEDRERADQQRAEDLERADRIRAEERERNDRMLALTENMMQQTADRAAAAEARAQAAEERAQANAAADRQLLVEALARFTDALERNANNRNGSNGS